MKIQNKFYLFFFILVVLIIQGCAPMNSTRINTMVVDVYSDQSIPANTGISTGIYTDVDGYRYVNIVVEFEQNTATEEPVSLGVVFAHSQNGNLGSRRYFTFDENFSGTADPQMITLSGNASWHGSQHKKSSYIARLPVMGPFVQVFPFNHHSEPRQFSIALYLVQ